MRAIASRRSRATVRSPTTSSTSTSRAASCRTTRRSSPGPGWCCAAQPRQAAWTGVLDETRRSCPGVDVGRCRPLPTESPTGGGVAIPELVPWGSPAFAAGLEEADVITTVDGRPVAGVEQWRSAIGARRPGDRIAVGYIRDGAKAATTLTLGEDPAMEVVARRVDRSRVDAGTAGVSRRVAQVQAKVTLSPVRLSRYAARGLRQVPRVSDYTVVGTTVQHYRIAERLGAGGMGEVSRAEDLRLGRPVALNSSGGLKSDPESRARLLNEARAASMLRSPEHRGHLRHR